jgi:signal transduction histidine kinase/FixJ family two-component response regulator
MRAAPAAIDKATGRGSVWIPIGLCAVAFLADFLTPMGVADAFTYVVAVIACVLVRDRRWVLYVAGAATVLLAAGLWLAHSDQVRTEPIADVNRALGVVTLWIVAALVWWNLRAAEALRASREQAQQASLTKSRFLAVASHDLRQPLQTAGVLSGALVRLSSDPRVHDIAERQQRALGSATRLLNTLLDLSKLESGALDPTVDNVDLSVLFARLKEELSHQASQKGMSLRVEPTGLRVRSDRQWLRQILQNLLTNALCHTPAGGEVVLAARGQSDQVSIEVRDTGPGIPAEQLERIFDEFYKIDSPAAEGREGWGLGLSIVRHAAARLGHRVGVQSELGRGTTFTVTLPGAPAPAPTAQPVEGDGRETHAAAAPAAGGGRRVLLVDDDDAVAAATGLWLKTEGFEVDLARGSADVTRLLATPGFSPDLILSDLHLGEAQTGVDVVRAVRERLRRTVPAIFVSGETQPDALRAGDLECVRFMSKPVQTDELLRAIQGFDEHRPAAVRERLSPAPERSRSVISGSASRFR